MTAIMDDIVVLEDKQERKNGPRKWFKRYSGDEKRKHCDSEKKKRSGSIFARLCFANKRKNKSRPEIEVSSGEGEASKNENGDEWETEQATEVTPSVDGESQSFAHRPSSLNETDRSAEQMAVADVAGDHPMHVVAIVDDTLEKIKRDWMEFGKSLGIGEEEISDVLQSANIVYESFNSAQTTKPVTDEIEDAQKFTSQQKNTADEDEVEDEVKIQCLVLAAASLALDSLHDSASRGDLPEVSLVGVPWDTSNCVSLALMTEECDEKENVMSDASAKGAEALPSFHGYGAEEESVHSRTIPELETASLGGCSTSGVPSLTMTEVTAASCSASSFTASSMSHCSDTMATTKASERVSDLVSLANESQAVSLLCPHCGKSTSDGAGTATTATTEGEFEVASVDCSVTIAQSTDR